MKILQLSFFLGLIVAVISCKDAVKQSQNINPENKRIDTPKHFFIENIYLDSIHPKNLSKEDLNELAKLGNKCGDGSVEIPEKLRKKIVDVDAEKIGLSCKSIREIKGDSFLLCKCFLFMSSDTTSNSLLLTYNKKTGVLSDALCFRRDKYLDDRFFLSYSAIESIKPGDGFSIWIFGPVKSSGLGGSRLDCKKQDIWDIDKNGKFILLRSDTMFWNFPKK